MKPDSAVMQSCIERIAVMRCLEDSVYTPTPTMISSRRPSSMEDTPCRNQMAQWFLRLTDACKYGCETVEIAVQLLDRFVQVEGGAMIQDRRMYQLAAMAALYTTIKVHETTAVSSRVISRLSAGAHSYESVEDMERRLLQTLQWRVHPPTAFSFAREVLGIIAMLLNPMQYTLVENLTRRQLELTIPEARLIRVPASWRAYAALRNALECVLFVGGNNHQHGNSMVEEDSPSITMMPPNPAVQSMVKVVEKALQLDCTAGTSMKITANATIMQVMETMQQFLTTEQRRTAANSSGEEGSSQKSTGERCLGMGSPRTVL